MQEVLLHKHTNHFILWNVTYRCNFPHEFNYLVLCSKVTRLGAEGAGWGGGAGGAGKRGVHSEADSITENRQIQACHNHTNTA